MASAGDVFSGATLPYGLAKAVADSDSDGNQGGFVGDNGNITGFSSLHDSGTGGSPSLGNFALFPYASCPGGDVNLCVFPKKARKMHYKNDSLIATPGYFTLTLESGVEAEMTTAMRTSLFNFKFPASADGNNSSPLILMDLTDLSDSRQDNGTISVDSETGRMQGGARFVPSFGTGSYVAYFCADFSGASIRDSGIFVDSRASSDVHNLTISRSINGYPLPGGGWVRFATDGDSEVKARVGLSFISSEQACSNAEAEIPDFDFKSTLSAAVAKWTSQLSPIQVSTSGVNDSLLTNFYSGIYRAYVNPQNYTGENPLWQSAEPYFDSYYW